MDVAQTIHSTCDVQLWERLTQGSEKLLPEISSNREFRRIGQYDVIAKAPNQVSRVSTSLRFSGHWSPMFTVSERLKREL